MKRDISDDVVNLDLAWVQDMNAAKETFAPAYAILKRMIDKGLILIPLEGIKTTECATLDRKYGFDYWGFTSDHLQFGVAWRDQKIKHGRKPFNAFSVRAVRETGVETEYTKRKHAIENQEPFPHYWVHVFHDEETKEILSMAVTTTKDLISYIDTYKPELKDTGPNQIGQASFYPVFWKDMIEKRKYNIITYTKENGIVRGIKQ